MNLLKKILTYFKGKLGIESKEEREVRERIEKIKEDDPFIYN
jgi:hypothetical protein